MKTPMLVTDFLKRARLLYRDSVGAVCGGQRFTYGQLGERVDRFSNALAAGGVRKGDVVAYVSFNCHRLLEGYYAVPQLGAILLPINIRLTPADVAYILNDAGANTVVIDRSLAGLLAPIVAQLPDVKRYILMGGDPKADVALRGDDYETLIETAKATPPKADIDEDDVAELFYTSGTTARPKGVMLTHRNLHYHGLVTPLANPTSDADVVLHSIPLFHVNGWGTPHVLTMLGGRHVMVPRFDPELVLDAIERERCTAAFFVPTMVMALMAAPSWPTRDLSSLRILMFGGAATPPSLIRALDQRLPGCLIRCGYGLSETTPVLTVAYTKSGQQLDAEQSVRVRSTAGMPIPGVEIEILDDSGKFLPHDGASVGEICARGNSVFKGYWKQPEETAKYIVDGWFHTGDMGVMDDQGYVSIVDRKKDIIITGGENVASIEIEKAIYENPAVLECAVIALPDAQWGEVPAAIVVLKPGQALDEAGLLESLRSRLARFKMPKIVRFTAALPKGGTGKILKRELRETYAKEKSAAPAS
jgi:fatty-acyl-CoA synthase